MPHLWYSWENNHPDGFAWVSALLWGRGCWNNSHHPEDFQEGYWVTSLPFLTAKIIVRYSSARWSISWNWVTILLQAGDDKCQTNFIPTSNVNCQQTSTRSSRRPLCMCDAFNQSVSIVLGSPTFIEGPFIASNHRRILISVPYSLPIKLLLSSRLSPLFAISVSADESFLMSNFSAPGG